VAAEESKNRAVEFEPCADSNLTLKEQMKKLDTMELVDNNKSAFEKTDEDKSVA
jgi:hypothetical protein